MNKYALSAGLGLLLLFLCVSCEGNSWFNSKKPEQPDSLSLNNKYVNNWIYQQMLPFYYWTDKMPTPEDFTQAPEQFFDHLLYHYHPVTAPDGDRFSYINRDYAGLLSSISGVRSQEIGFNYQLYLVSTESGGIVGQVTYVKPGTPAAEVGVQRGWWFDQVQGISLNTSNYSELLRVLPAELSLRFLTEPPGEIPNSFEAYLEAMPKLTLSFAPLAHYAENPNYLDTIYEIDNKKIGYFVCNFFAFDSGDASDQFLIEMNDVFGRFKAANLDELILDLRYNSGGYVLMSTYLAGMIVPNLSAEKVFGYFRHNDFLQELYKKQYGEEYLKMYFREEFSTKDSQLSVRIHNLNLDRLFVLTGNYTASASEQLINGLRAYMPLVLIGEQTYGKNVSSLVLYEPNDSQNQWGIQPIIAKMFNSLGASDYTAGFVPDIQLTELSVYDQSALGDTQEILLKAALAQIMNTPLSLARSAKFEAQEGPVLLREEDKIRGALLLQAPKE